MRTICEVIDYGGATGGSFIPAMSHLARAVTARGDRFVVVSSDVPGATWYDELRDAGAELRLLRNGRELAPAVRSVRADIVHSHFNKYDVALALSGLKSTILWHVHSFRENFTPLDEARARIKYMLIGAGVRKWLCVSGGVARQVLERGAPKARVQVVSNGINTERFRPPTHAERCEARERFGIADGDRVVLFFDRTPVKGGAVLRAALEGMRGYRLLLNGGPPEDWADFRRSHDVIQSPRLADPRPLYWAADAFVLASFGEGCPFVLAEAAASGLPIATSDIPPALEMVGGCKDAFIFPVGDADALRKALTNALERGPSTALRSRIVESFSLERWTDDLLRIYDSV